MYKNKTVLGVEAADIFSEDVQCINRICFSVEDFWCGWEGPKVWNFYEGPLTLGLVPPEYRQTRIRNLLCFSSQRRRCLPEGSICLPYHKNSDFPSSFGLKFYRGGV